MRIHSQPFEHDILKTIPFSFDPPPTSTPRDLLLQHGFIQAHRCTETRANEDCEVASQNALVDGCNRKVLVEATESEMLGEDQVGNQALGETENEGVELHLCAGLVGGLARRVAVARMRLEWQIDKVGDDRRQDE